MLVDEKKLCFVKNVKFSKISRKLLTFLLSDNGKKKRAFSVTEAGERCIQELAGVFREFGYLEKNEQVSQ